MTWGTALTAVKEANTARRVENCILIMGVDLTELMKLML